MTHEEILTTLGHYVDYLIAGSTAEAPLWNIEKVRSGKPNKWNYIDHCLPEPVQNHRRREVFGLLQEVSGLLCQGQRRH